MRRLIVTGLLFCLLAPMVITYAWMRHRQSCVRREVKHRLMEEVPREELVLLRLSAADAEAQLHWKHGAEFEYRNQMYDVVEMATLGDSVFYWCWWDHEETRLNRQLRSLLARLMGGDPQNRDHQTRLGQLIQSFYCSAVHSWRTPQLPLLLPGTRDAAALSQANRPPPVPPPQPG